MFSKSFFFIFSVVLIVSQVECSNPAEVTGSRPKRGIDIDSLQPVGFNAHVSQPQTDTSNSNQQQLDPSSYYNQQHQQQQLDPSSYYNQQQQQQLDPSSYYQQQMNPNSYYQQPTEYQAATMNGYQYQMDPSQYQPVGFNAAIMSSEQMHNAGDSGSRGNGVAGGLSMAAGGFSNGLGTF